MTELLRRLIVELEKLPDERQDAIASRFLTELKDEQHWITRFEDTTDEQWDRMAAMVRQDIADGETISLDEVFPA